MKFFVYNTICYSFFWLNFFTTLPHLNCKTLRLLFNISKKDLKFEMFWNLNYLQLLILLYNTSPELLVYFLSPFWRVPHLISLCLLYFVNCVLMVNTIQLTKHSFRQVNCFSLCSKFYKVFKFPSNLQIFNYKDIFLINVIKKQ